jgi:acyl-coenzyme A thioesterase PaaI-like protein
MTPQQLEATLNDNFAPWVLALGLRVLAFDDPQSDGLGVSLLLPHSDQLARVGGIACGQALMAAADTAMGLAIARHLGEFKPCTTVQMNTSFLKPLANQDALVQARVIRAGKALVFGEIDIRGASDGKSVCRVTATWALL